MVEKDGFFFQGSPQAERCPRVVSRGSGDPSGVQGRQHGWMLGKYGHLRSIWVFSMPAGGGGIPAGSGVVILCGEQCLLLSITPGHHSVTYSFPEPRTMYHCEWWLGLGLIMRSAVMVGSDWYDSDTL